MIRFNFLQFTTIVLTTFLSFSSCEKNDVVSPSCDGRTTGDEKVCVDGELVCPTGPDQPYYSFRDICIEATASEYFTTTAPLPECFSTIVVPEETFELKPLGSSEFFNAPIKAFGDQVFTAIRYEVNGLDSVWVPHVFSHTYVECSDGVRSETPEFAFGVVRLSDIQLRMTVYELAKDRSPETVLIGRNGVVDSVRFTLEKHKFD